MRYKYKFHLFFLFCFLMVGACSGPFHKKTYYIGVDPTFFPLNLKGQAINLFAFTNELLQEIGKQKHVNIVRVGSSWDNLLDGLRLQKYQAVLSSMPPNLINSSKYSFSDTYVRTGPVLIVSKQNRGASLESLSKRIVAVEKTGALLELMSHYPEIETLFYEEITSSLENLSKGIYDGVMVPIILAGPYVKDIFHDTLVISSDTLTEEGIRLVTEKSTCPELIALFNDGIDELCKNGTFDALLEKWNLTQ